MTNLISGKEALIALANGEEVESINRVIDRVWVNAKDLMLVESFLDPNTTMDFRLKPRTITLNVEIPAPFEPKEGDIVWVISDYRNGYREIQYNKSIYNAFGAWRTEEEIKQVVSALRTVFKN